MALIALTSTIVLTNASFLDRYNSDQIPSYEDFLKYLNEESSLKKKKVAWFVGDQSQSARILVNNEWEILPLEKDFFPVVNLDVVFKDFSGSSFNISDERAEPFIIFDPIGIQIIKKKYNAASFPPNYILLFFLYPPIDNSVAL